VRITGPSLAHACKTGKIVQTTSSSVLYKHKRQLVIINMKQKQIKAIYLKKSENPSFPYLETEN